MHGVYIIIFSSKFKAVLFHATSMILKDQNTRVHLPWTAGNRDPMHEVCIPHRHSTLIIVNVLCTQDTQRIGTAIANQEEEADARIIVIE